MKFKRFKKFRRFLKKNPFGYPVLIFSIIITILIGFLVSPVIIQFVTNEGDVSGGGGDSTIINDPWTFFIDDDYITQEIMGEYEEIIYVHQDGDNETGGVSWDDAYTDLPSAIARAEGTPFWTTLILVGVGTWDVLQPEAQYIDRNIILVGASRDSTIFINTHPTARSVFLVQDTFSGYRFTVRIEDTCDGIIVEENIIGGSYIPDVDLYDISFITNVTTLGSPQGLALGASYGGTYEKLMFPLLCHGTPIAINVSNSFHNIFDFIRIGDVDVGLLIALNGSDSNDFHDIEFHNNTLAIQIDAGNFNHFNDITFVECVGDIEDSVGDSTWHMLHDEDLNAIVSPNNLVGVDVDTSAIADTYGLNTIIRDALANHHPFYIVAILFEPDANERYGMRISDDNGITYIFETVVEARFAGQIERFEIPSIIQKIINAHSRMWVSIKSETGNDDMDIWLEIVEFD